MWDHKCPCEALWHRGIRDMYIRVCLIKLVNGINWKSLSNSHSPVLSELQSSVSFSALSPGLGPCFIQVAIVKWSVRFWGTTQSGILAAWRPSNLKIKSLSLPLSVTREAVQLVAALGAGRRSVLPDEAPGVIHVGTNKRCKRRCVNTNPGRFVLYIGLTLAMITYEWGRWQVLILNQWAEMDGGCEYWFIANETDSQKGKRCELIGSVL